MNKSQAWVAAIRQAVIGERQLLATPFGLKPLVYADYTASGRSLDFIEDFIRQRVMPFYANTHTETSATGRQTTHYREQAREAIRRSVNADAGYAVIFTGAGATAAINKCIDLLGLRAPSAIAGAGNGQPLLATDDRPVVFIGPYEHHSNELPWRESVADVVVIQLDAEGRIDCDDLEAQLQRYQHRPLKIASFSAASNVTGVKSDIGGVSALLKRHGVMICWDYAAAAPYVEINLLDNAIDAIFVSPHKFIGGPGTPGVLVIKKQWLTNTVPAMPGGGTVSWVSPTRHRYLPAGERKEEGGTPAIIESIRAGLVFTLKDRVGVATIETLEQQWQSRAQARLSRHPSIALLGPADTDSLAILSLQIRCAGRHLHYGFVVALLNDLFGIQVRGGCSCAGPYGHHLLGIDSEASQQLEAQIAAGYSVLKPGWVRFNLNYFIDEATWDYLMSALELIASHGWRLLPYYEFCQQRAVWRYRGQAELPLGNLEDCFAVLGNKGETKTEAVVNASTSRPILADYLQQAQQLLLTTATLLTATDPVLSPEAALLRWYTNPSDVCGLASRN